MANTKFYAEYTLTGNTQLLIEDLIYVKKFATCENYTMTKTGAIDLTFHYTNCDSGGTTSNVTIPSGSINFCAIKDSVIIDNGTGTLVDNGVCNRESLYPERYVGINKVPETKLDVNGQIKLSSGATYLEGEIRYKDKKLWVNTGGTSASWAEMSTSNINIYGTPAQYEITTWVNENTIRGGSGLSYNNLSYGFDINGSVNLSEKTVSMNTTLDPSHYTVLVDNTGTSTVTISLPNVTGTTENRIYFIKLFDMANAIQTGITIQAYGTQKISFSPSNTNTYYTSNGIGNYVMLQAYNTAWYVLFYNGNFYKI